MKQENKKVLSLYVHIPFCRRKCLYCDFLSFSGMDGRIEEYIRKVIWELKERSAAYRGYKLITVFIGGGTPSIAPAGSIQYLMESIGQYYDIDEDAEISIEANPGTLDIGKLKNWRKSGINRLSIGCQSLDDDELRILGRIHRADDFYKAYEMARSSGFDNINVDLMCALPGQRCDGFLKSLRGITDLQPEHVSVYSLMIEEKTPFYDLYSKADEMRSAGKEQDLLPSEEEERSMIHLGRDLLAKAGYYQYEISNYALPGRECRHNMVYWERGDYEGVGIGAASCVGDVRKKNTENMDRYLRAQNIDELTIEKQELTPEEIRSEAMFLGLRLSNGIDIQEYSSRYGKSPEVIYGDWILKMKKDGLLEYDGGYLNLTDRGRDLANYVMTGFV